VTCGEKMQIRLRGHANLQHLSISKKKAAYINQPFSHTLISFKIYMMKLLLLITLCAFATAGLLSYTFKQPEPKALTTECYVRCYETETRTLYTAEASTTAFAMLHENPLPFTLPNYKGSNVYFDVADGQQGMAYEIKAKKKTNNYLLVIHEWYGLNDYIKQEAEQLHVDLSEMNVLALDLYDGKVADNRDSAMKYIQAVNTVRLENIIKGAIAYAGKDARIFTVGWCFGGMWSLQASILAGKHGAGGVMYYGRPETDTEKLKQINGDVIGFFGNLDRSPTPELVNEFEEKMATAGKKLITNKYEAGHGFANPSNPSFNKAARDDAHAKTIAFLKARM